VGIDLVNAARRARLSGIPPPSPAVAAALEESREFVPRNETCPLIVMKLQRNPANSA